MDIELQIEMVRDRTSQRDTRKIINELNSAKDWAANLLHPLDYDLNITYDVEITPSTTTTTRDYDLAANVTAGHVLYGVKTLWVRFTSDDDFTPAVPLDSNHTRFQQGDIYQTSNTTDEAQGHPVYYTMRNFDMVRFSPPLPANTEIRVDYYRNPPDLSLDTNADIDAGDDIAPPVHHAIVDKATAQVFSNQDDTRAAYWDGQAWMKMRGALNTLRARQFQRPQGITPFTRRARRVL